MFENEYVLSTEAKDVVKLPLNNVKNLKDLKKYSFDSRYMCDTNGAVYLIKSLMYGHIYGYPMSSYVTRDNYVEYVLTTKYGKKHIQAHRIVAGLFLKEIKGKEYVNHKDGNRQNNKVDNLEWVNQSENIQHSWNFLRRRKTT